MKIIIVNMRIVGSRDDRASMWKAIWKVMILATVLHVPFIMMQISVSMKQPNVSVSQLEIIAQYIHLHNE